MYYREEKNVSKKYKEEYARGLEKLIKKREKEAEQKRKGYVRDIMRKPQKYREDLKMMLGWPLVEHEDTALPNVRVTKLSDEEGYSVYRMQFEILGCLTMTGLFFKADKEERRPLIILQHGGLGTPELISGVYGSTSNYNDMLQRVRKHNVHVFAPQLFLWDEEQYEVKRDRKDIDSRLKRVGSSIAAVEIYGIVRILDYFETEEYVSGFGMVGLSYGGFYTLFTTAVDTRIKSAISCSFFNKRDYFPWGDWTWWRSAEKFDDAEIAALVYPRRLCIEIGDKDELFECEKGKEAFESLKEICKEVGEDWVELIVFEGTHEFCKYDEPIERLINDVTNI